MANERKEGIRRELEALCKKHGRLTREVVVQWAQTNKRSYLHKEFEWDIGKAAYQHWLDRAGELIRYVTVMVVSGTREIKVPAYVHDPDIPVNAGGYVPTMRDRSYQSARRIMLEEMQRCEQAIERARGLCAALGTKHAGIESELEQMLSHIVVIRQMAA